MVIPQGGRHYSEIRVRVLVREAEFDFVLMRPDLILFFFQGLLGNSRAFSTLYVFVAAFSACHVSFDGKTDGAPTHFLLHERWQMVPGVQTTHLLLGALVGYGWAVFGSIRAWE